jgi:hypothetical protein
MVKLPSRTEAPPTPIVEETATDEESEVRADLKHLSMILGSGFPSQGMMSMTRIELEGGILNWGHVNQRTMILNIEK